MDRPGRTVLGIWKLVGAGPAIDRQSVIRQERLPVEWSEPYRERAAKFGAAIGIPSGSLPLFGEPERNNLAHDQRHWISRVQDGYRLLWFDSGTAMSKRDFADADEALYQFFCDYTEIMAREQVRSRNPTHRDERVPVGEIQVRLLAKASEAWAARREKEVAAEIVARPYQDPPHPFANVPFYYISDSTQDVTGDTSEARRATAKRPAE
ncbi:MAG TPA: hypothetical protein VF669_09340 [Tepidisphaeraceae bacterium]|jgi:uncharacterized protein YecT (DUF1311 family)